MASPARARAGTSSPASRVSRDDLRRDQHSPYRHHPRNPSSEIWEEFSNLMINEERVFQKQQDENDAEQQRLHRLALEQAAAEHERVRQNAERARERVELEIERERKRREDEELRALEAERKAKADRDAAERQRVKEDLERQEQEQRRRAAEEKEIRESQARLAEQKRKEEADATQRKRDEEEADRKAKEAAAAAAEAAAATAQPTPAPTQPAAAQPTQPTQSAQPAQPDQPAQLASTAGTNSQTQPTAPAAAAAQQPSTAQPAAHPNGQNAGTGSTPTSPAAQREASHRQYLALHQHLKTMRRNVIAQCKAMPTLKGQLGEWRRLLTRTIGQLTMNAADNRAHSATVLQTLTAAQEFATPSVDVSSFILSVPTDDSPKPMSGPLVYLLNIVAKCVVSQLINEMSSSSNISDGLGVLAISVFSKPAYSYGGTLSLIDILLAKYHVVCPILWGIYGDEKTARGRERIGWWKENGNWLDEQLHINRMTGLAKGYASLTLRDFSRSQNINPYPPSNYWKALSYIVNTPPAELQPTHFIVLKALIDGHIPRFLGFYGQAGLVALRKALIEVPASAAKGAARDGVMVMPQTIQRDLMLTL